MSIEKYFQVSECSSFLVQLIIQMVDDELETETLRAEGKLSFVLETRRALKPGKIVSEYK